MTLDGDTFMDTLGLARSDLARLIHLASSNILRLDMLTAAAEVAFCGSSTTSDATDGGATA